MQDKNTKRYIGMLSILAFCILFFLNRDRYLPYVTLDEIAPIGVAAYFNGHDWSAMVATMLYYSYGIDVILIPLMHFFDDPVTFYRAGVTVNCLLVAVQIPLLYKIFENKFEKTDKKLLATACFVFAMSTSSIVRAGTLWCETLLIVIFLITIIILDRVKDNTKVIAGLFGFSLVFMYVMHQRNIGIVIAGLIVILLMFYKKDISKESFFSFIVVFVITLFVHSIIKDYIKEVVWLNSTISQGNDFGSIPELLRELLSFDGIVRVLQKSLGCIFYVGAATFGLAYIGIYAIIKRLYLNFKYKDNEEYKDIYVELYLILSFLALVGITGIFFVDANERIITYYFYDRYIFFSVAPLALYGLSYINKIKDIKIFLVIQIVFLIITTTVAQYASGEIFAYTSSMYFNIFWIDGELNYFLIVVITITIFNLIILCYEKKYIRYIPLLCISSFYILASPYSINKANEPGEIWNYSEMVEIIKQENTDGKVYVIADDNDKAKTFMLQYQMFNKPVYPIGSEDLGLIGEGEYLITSLVNDEILNNYKVIYASNLGILLKKGYQNGGLPILETSNSEIDNINYKSEDESGLLIYGQYIKAEAGMYNIEISVEQYEDKGVEQIGAFDIVGLQNKEMVIFDQQELKKSDLVDGKYVYSADVEFLDEVSRLEIRFFANENTYMKVNDVKIKNSDKIVVSTFNEDILENYSFVDNTQNGFLFEKNPNADGMQLLNFCSSQISDGDYKSGAASGALIYGPYISVEEGNYDVEVSVEQYADSIIDEIGTFDVVGVQNGEQVVLAQQELHKKDLTNDKYVYNTEIELLKDVSNLEIRFVVKEDAYMKVNEVKLNAIK